MGCLAATLLPYSPPVAYAWVWLDVAGDQELLESAIASPTTILSRDFWVADAATGEFLFGLVSRACAPGGTVGSLGIGGYYDFEASAGGDEMGSMAARAEPYIEKACREGSKWITARLDWTAVQFPQFEGGRDDVWIPRASLSAPYLHEHRLVVFGQVDSVRVATGVGRPGDCRDLFDQQTERGTGQHFGQGSLNGAFDLGDDYGYLMCVKYNAQGMGQSAGAVASPTLLR